MQVEASIGPSATDQTILNRIRGALEGAGVEFLPEIAGSCGVRLRVP